MRQHYSARGIPCDACFPSDTERRKETEEKKMREKREISLRLRRLGTGKRGRGKELTRIR
jgi:hypothetical protein